MRHGIAYDTSEWNGTEFDRPLTKDGEVRTRKILQKLKTSGDLQVDAIWSSPLKRARQTAEIAAQVLGMEIVIIDALQCGADVYDIIHAFQKSAAPARLLTVGHEPDCGMILGDLIGEDNCDLAFKRAGIAQVHGELKPGGMKLIWKYAPKDVLGE